MNSVLSTFAATLFALLDSLGVMPVFVGFASKERLAVERFVVLLISLTVFGLLALFLITGQALLKFFGIDLDCFRIAGGSPPADDRRQLFVADVKLRRLCGLFRSRWKALSNLPMAPMRPGGRA